MLVSYDPSLELIINYYHKFLPNLSEKLAPLYQLLRKDVRWTWEREQNQAFEAAKQALQNDSPIVHYDESKRLILACDASGYGLGAVLSHVMEDGTERPVAYASRTLTSAEKNYSQLEKEGLAIVYGVKKFHNYLFGRHLDRVRSPAFIVHFQRRQGNFSDSFPSNSKVGSNVEYVPLYCSL